MTLQFSVAVYFVDLSYGGPEEGGWYYEHGDLQATADWETNWFVTREAAITYRTTLQANLDAEHNAGRPQISASNSRGRFQARVYEGEPPQHFPTMRPHYE